jgi:hypothetical protein
VLGSDGRRHLPKLGVAEGWYRSAYPERIAGSEDESCPRQHVEVLGAGERALPGGGGDQAEQVGYRSRPEGGNPESTHVRVMGGKADRSIRQQAGGQAGSPPYGSATRTTRRGCGGDRDGRTRVAFVSG